MTDAGVAELLAWSQRHGSPLVAGIEVDAEAAARAVLAGQTSAVPKDREGAVESVRAVTITRNSAVIATTTTSDQIKALLGGAEQALRDEMQVQSQLQLATRCSQLAPVNGLQAALVSLGRRWLQLHGEVIALDRLIRGTTTSTSCPVRSPR